jgi:hypothetical protein
MSDLHTDIDMHSLASVTAQDAKNTKVKIRIPKRIWNASEPCAPAHTSHIRKLVIRTHPKSKSGRRTVLKDLATDAALLPTSPKGCKVKLWRFQYGGPRHVVKGAQQSQVTLDSPCLRATCANCWRWHTHLMYDQKSPDEHLEQEVNDRPAFELGPTCPEIDPRILNGNWNVAQSPSTSAESTTSLALTEMSTSMPTLTPVKFSSPSCDQSPGSYSCPYEMMNADPLRVCADVSLPKSLISAAMPIITMEYLRRSAHHRPRTTCLVFSSDAGKKEYRDLIKRRERKLKKQAYDRAYRAKMKLGKQQEQRNTL